MLLKRKVDIETAKADIEGVNALHKIAQNKSADRYITKSDSSIALVLHYNGARKYRRTRHTSVKSNGLYAKARYSVLHDNDRLFMSKYLTYLPTKEQLKAEIERQKEIFYMQHPALSGNEKEGMEE